MSDALINANNKVLVLHLYFNKHIISIAYTDIIIATLM